MRSQATTDEPTEVVKDTVYQVQKPDGTFVPKYVKVTKTYGDGLEPDQVEGEVVLDRENPAAVGRTGVFARSRLRVPDTYPGVMGSPEKWVAKANQTQEQLEVEVSAAVDAWFRTEGMIALAGIEGVLGGQIDQVMEAVRIALTGFFGGFTLVAVLHWLRSKIETNMAARGDQGRHILPFERKLGSMKRELDERKRNLETPEADRGEFNAKHPFGVPRQVQQFQHPSLAG